MQCRASPGRRPLRAEASLTPVNSIRGTVGVNDLALAVKDQQDGRNRIKEMAGDKAVGEIFGMALQLGIGGPIGVGC